tara:strand:+ start:3150 stop:3776 length:627 start_codon:yes stop_codon:yes gene_type:complete
MFASLEPRLGTRLDVYPSHAQPLISPLQPGESIALGKDCFGAKLTCTESGKLYQTTPKVGNKPPGYREVVRIDNVDHLTVYESRNGWRVVREHLPDGARTMQLCIKDVNVMPPARFGWQWSTNTNIATASNGQWIPYSDQDSTSIENAYDTGSEIQLSIGLKQYTIQFLRDDTGEHIPYGMQIDERRMRTRYPVQSPLKSVSKFFSPT